VKLDEPKTRRALPLVGRERRLCSVPSDIALTGWLLGRTSCGLVRESSESGRDLNDAAQQALQRALLDRHFEVCDF
jgi:hypothetical protein